MNDFELRTLDDGLNCRAEGADPQIFGYFAKFNSLSGPIQRVFKEKILPGAFRSSLSDGRDIKALYHHDPKLILGSSAAGTFRLREDGQGLYGEVDPPRTSTASDVVANMRAGNIRGASIGYNDVKGGFKWTQEDGWDVRLVNNASMFEGTITGVPAFKSTLLQVRSACMEFGDEDSALICRALNRVEHHLDIVDEDKDVLRNYRSQLDTILGAEKKALMDKLLEPKKELISPAALGTWLDIVLISA